MAMIREKAPEADLRRSYNKVFGICNVITLVATILVAVIYPSFEANASDNKKKQIIIETVDIPETQQVKRPPPPPRPAVPIETESDDVPDDVTIESTDLDFDDAMVDLPPPPPPGEEEEVEEILEFYMVEDKPEAIHQVAPTYPEIARKAGLTGKVFLKFLVGKDGRVSNVQVLRGQEIFKQPAIDAIMQFRFKPARQNDKPVAVWMTQPISFRLN
jgi:periplasmic protein TonB